MNRRHFFKLAAAVATLPTVVHAAPGGKCRVCVIGVDRAISAADPIRWTAPLWLDEERFELSVLLLGWKTWGPGHALLGSFGEIPPKFIRPWGDLSWMAEDLRAVDIAIVLADLWSEAREPIVADVLAAARSLAPRVVTITLEPWHPVDGRLVPDPDPRVSEARMRVFSASSGVVRVQSNGAAMERLQLHADRGGRGLDILERQRLWRRVMGTEADQFAKPVIRMLAKASRTHFLPSADGVMA